MKTFKYRWKMGDNEYTGERECVDEVALRDHVKKVGGELIEILEARTKETTSDALPQEPKSSSIDHDTIRKFVSAPEVLPCEFDRTLEFWVERISLWGKLIITHYFPGHQPEAISKEQLIDILSDKEDMDEYGKWSVNKLSVKSVEIYRNYYDQDGEKKQERIVVDIDLDQDLKDALKKKPK